MAVFWRLILGHFIADFSLQTNHIAHWKRSSKWGMLVHILTHPVTYAVVTWPYLSQPWVSTRAFHLNGWTCVGLIALMHWLEDEWRVWSIQRSGSPDSTSFFLWDQVVHLVIIFALSPALGTSKAEPWVLLTLCGVLLAHFTSVLIFFMENDWIGESHILGARKYRYIFERLIGAGLFILPGAWFFLAAGWVGWLAYLQYGRPDGRTWIHQIVAGVTVAFLGLVARGILFT